MKSILKKNEDSKTLGHLKWKDRSFFSSNSSNFVNALDVCLIYLYLLMQCYF